MRLSIALKLRRSLPGLVMLLAAGSSASSAQTLPTGFDLRAKDAVDVFAMRCLATHGDRTQAEHDFGSGIDGADRVPDNALVAAERGLSGGAGWVLRTFHNAVFMLEYDPRGICGIRLIEADENSVQVAVSALANAAAVVAKSTLTTLKPTTHAESGAKTTLEDYSFPVDSHIAHITLSTSDHKMAAQQHFLTLSYSKPN